MREIRMLRVMWRELETGSRTSLAGHEGGNPGYRQGMFYRVTAPALDPTNRQQIERGLDNDPVEAAKARVILRDLLGPIQMCPGEDGSLWAQYHTRPAALVKRAVGASVELSGSGGVICAVPPIPTRVRVK